MITLRALMSWLGSRTLSSDATVRSGISNLLTNVTKELSDVGVDLKLVDASSVSRASRVADTLLLARTYAAFCDCLLLLQIGGDEDAGVELLLLTAGEANLPRIGLDSSLDSTSLVARLREVRPKSASIRSAALRQLWRRRMDQLAELDPLLRDAVLGHDVVDVSTSITPATAHEPSFREIPGSFAVEAVGVDCRSVDAHVLSRLAEVLQRHKLIIFHDQDLSEDDQLRFTAHFGKPDMAWDKRNRASDEPRIQVISNQYEGGQYHYDRSRRLSTVRYWHADTSFLPNPTRFTFLSIQQVPERHGLTHFANTQLAYAALPPGLAAMVQNRFVCHSFEYIFGPLLRIRNDRHEMTVPDTHHPLVWQMPSGECLYLSELSQSHIVGMSADASDKLLTQVMEHCTQLPFRYTHAWRPGDFLVWDNLGLMHKGGFADPEYPRVLHRSTVTMADVRPAWRIDAAAAAVGLQT